MRHLDIESALRGKNSAESIAVGSAAICVVRVEQSSIRPAAATKEPTTVRIRKVGVIATPGLVVA